MKSVSINRPRFGVVEYHVKNDHIKWSELGEVHYGTSYQHKAKAKCDTSFLIKAEKIPRPRGWGLEKTKLSGRKLRHFFMGFGYEGSRIIEGL